MQNNEHKGSLSDKFTDFGAPASDGLWTSIASQLDEKKKKRFVIWWWTGGVIAASLLFTLAWFYWPTNKLEKNNMLAGKAETTKQITKTAQTKEITTQKLESKSVQAKEGKQATQTTVVDTKQTIRILNGKRILKLKTQKDKTEFQAANAILPEVLKPENIFKDERNSVQNAPDDLALAVDSLNSEKKDSIDPIIQNTIAIMEQKGVTELPKVIAPKWKLTASYGNRLGFGTVKPNVDPNSFSSSNTTFVNYSWSTELSIARRFGKQFWLETGAYFNSWNDRFQKPKDKFNSLSYLGFGAPLQLNFTYLQRGRLSLYVGGGLNYEYLFRKNQSYTQEFLIAGVDLIQQKNNPKMSLLSAQLQTGMELKCYRNFSFVLEPVVKQTVFQDKVSLDTQPFNKKLWLGCTAGISWMF